MAYVNHEAISLRLLLAHPRHPRGQAQARPCSTLRDSALKTRFCRILTPHYIIRIETLRDFQISKMAE
jgi:hypothetical protein